MDGLNFLDLISACLVVLRLLLFVKDRGQRGGLLLDLGRSTRGWVLTAIGILTLLGAVAVASLVVLGMQPAPLLPGGGFLLLWGLYALSGGQSSQLREQGIWYGGWLLRWEQVTAYTWEDPARLQLYLRGWWPFWTRCVVLLLPAGSEAAVAGLLSQRGVHGPVVTR